MSEAVRAAIIQAAQDEGIDPATALAYAERESTFNPRAHASRTIHGLYQMRGDLRQKFGVGDSEDPYEQTQGFGRFQRALKQEMARGLGRMPTDEEAYLGHHYGGKRGALALNADPETPVTDFFTREERAANPHFDRAGTIGNLNASLLSDIGQRRAKWGGGGQKFQVPDFSDRAEAAPDFSDLADVA